MGNGSQAIVLIQDKCLGSSLTLHRVNPEAVQFSSNDGLDEPLEVKPEFNALFLQPAVTNGLVADGVTPLLLCFSPTNSPDTNVEYKIRFELDAATGSLNSPLEDHLYVHDGSAFVRTDSIT